MEGAILLGLAGIGYLFNKEKDSTRIESNVKPQVFQNSNSSIYDLNNYSDSKQYEADLLNQNFQQTLDNQSNMYLDYNAKMKEVEHMILSLD